MVGTASWWLMEGWESPRQATKSIEFWQLWCSGLIEAGGGMGSRLIVG